MEELAVGARADLVDDGRLEVEEDAARDVLARARLGEEGVEGVVAGADVGGGLAVGLDSEGEGKLGDRFCLFGWVGMGGRRRRRRREREIGKKRVSAPVVVEVGKKKNLVFVVCWSSPLFFFFLLSLISLFSLSNSPVLEAVELPAGVSDLDACAFVLFRFSDEEEVDVEVEAERRR